jgi:hypothetical protein
MRVLVILLAVAGATQAHASNVMRVDGVRYMAECTMSS